MKLKRGKVSSLSDNKVIVVFDEDDLLSDELLLLNFEYNPPKVDEPVICIVPDTGVGLCISGYLSAGEIPDAIYKKVLSDQNVITVDNEGKLVINASNIKVIGNVEVVGTITSSGAVSAGGVVLS